MMTEMENTIQLKKRNTLKFKIVDEEGKETGNFLEFDLEDIELPLRLNKCDAIHKKNLEYVKYQLINIEKKEDKKGKYILSWKEEEKIKLFNEFYKKEQEALDLFLGENGTKKLLNGRNPYVTMYDDIGEMLEPIMEIIKNNAIDIKEKIKNKYSIKEEDVLE